MTKSRIATTAFRKAIAAALVAAILILGSLPIAHARDLDPAMEAEANSIFGSVMSPFCAGRLLQDCPSSGAHDLKEKIRDMIAEGKNRDDITGYLVTMYGDEILAAPKNEGFGRVAWIAPFAFLMIGFALIVFWLRRQKQTSVTDDVVALDKETEIRVQKEMDRSR